MIEKEPAPMELPDELVGRWIVDQSGKVVGDEVEQLIQAIVRDSLTGLAEKDGGWTKLYFNSTNDSYWELTFPHSELQGGGPAKLTRIAAELIPQLYPGLALL